MVDIPISKIVLTFDNNLSYEVNMDSALNPDERFIYEYTGSQSDAVLSGNPLGVTTSDSRNFSIYDPNNILMANNEKSPYYGYMRSGVMVEPYIYENGMWNRDGVYYVDNWGTGYRQNGNDLAVINCSDKLQYLLSQEIPKLPIYSGLTVKEFIEKIFSEIGLGADEYYIDTTLDVDMLYGVNTDDNVGDFLNNMSQALMARVNVDKNGVIQIRPALQSYGDTFVLERDDLLSIESKINYSSCMYSKAKLNYIKTGKDMNGGLASNSGVTLEKGLNEFTGIKLTGSRAKEITDVSFELPDNVDIDSITDFHFNAYQGGIDIFITNNTGSVIEDVQFVVNGRYVTGIDKYEETSVVGSDIKVSNVLNIQNDMIQNMSEAKKLVSKISEYLTDTQYLVYLESTLSPRVFVGDRIIINCGISKFDGTYKVIESDTNYSPKDYSKNLTLVLDKKAG